MEEGIGGRLGRRMGGKGETVERGLGRERISSVERTRIFHNGRSHIFNPLIWPRSSLTGSTALGAGCEQNGCHRGGLSDTIGHNVGLDQVHCVQNSRTGGGSLSGGTLKWNRTADQRLGLHA